jgi:hypothetical protein
LRETREEFRAVLRASHGAQRLTASLRETQRAQELMQQMKGMCSTPDGIIARNTGIRVLDGSVVVVLNA